MAEEKEKRDGCEGRPAIMSSIGSVDIGSLHLATAEDISLRLSFCGYQAMVVGLTFIFLEWIGM